MSIASTSPDRATLAELEHRASLYKLVALGFLFPGEEVARLFAADGAVARGNAGAEGGACVLARFGRFLTERRLTPDDMVREYNRLFLGERPVQLLECEHSCRHEFEKAKTLADIMGFYRAFAVAPQAERADHISSELEFMFWLMLKERQAVNDGDPDHLAVAQDAARKFLAEHLGVWSNALIESLEKRAEPGSFYVRLAEVLKVLLAKEQQRLGKV